MQDIRKNVVYSPYWQRIRMLCKGNWVKDIDQNIRMLEHYLGDRSDITRVWRVLNTLNATRMGFHGMQLIGSDVDRKLVEFRDELSALYTALAEDGHELVEVTEDQVRREWAELDLNIRRQIFDDLYIRYAKHNRSAHREDLQWFLNLVGNS